MDKASESSEKTHKNVKQEQIQDILFSREIGWQELIYDLINTEQLDPWDINIIILTDKYLERIRAMEEADFFVSSKVLLAAALLLRIKSEILLNDYIKSIDEILFGKKDNLERKPIEKIELDEEIPGLQPKSPLPRFKRVSLKELMESLNKAIVTENRRIKKEIIKKNAVMESSISLPKKKISIHDRIKDIYESISRHFKENKQAQKVSFNEFFGPDREQKLVSFAPLLYLDHQKKVWLSQEKHFIDFDIWLREIFLKNNPDPLEDLRLELEKQAEAIKKDKIKKHRLDKINKDFENPIEGI